MKLLLDTHILLGVVGRRTDVFPTGIQRLLDDPTSVFLVSVGSLWEIAIKFRLGKLRVMPDLDSLPGLISSLGIELIPITQKHVLVTVEPEPPTRDPFDRLLLAQCLIEGLGLVTIDRALVGHPLAARSV